MVKVTLPADPWQEETTISGLHADEVISALQKSIRRGLLENAVLIGQEMIATSEALEAKLWQRLSVISVEDIGHGDLQMPVLVETLYQQSQRLPYGEHDRLLFALHAIRVLCEAEKDRSSDDMANWARRSVELGENAPEIPDVAKDMHTRAGQEQGRDYRHFIEEASQVQPASPHADMRWRNWLIAALDEGKLS